MRPPFDDAREFWLAGLCPCCGHEVTGWKDGGIVHEPRAVAEGVIMCGECAGLGHGDPDGLLTLLLESLLP